MLAKNIDYTEHREPLSGEGVGYDTSNYNTLKHERLSKCTVLQWERREDYKKKSYKKSNDAHRKVKSNNSLNESNKLHTEFNFATDQVEDTYQKLWAAIKAGEGWAYKIYWQCLLPKSMYQDRIILDDSKDELEACLEGLGAFTEINVEGTPSVENRKVLINTDEEIADFIGQTITLQIVRFREHEYADFPTFFREKKVCSDVSKRRKIAKKADEVLDSQFDMALGYKIVDEKEIPVRVSMPQVAISI